MTARIFFLLFSVASIARGAGGYRASAQPEKKKYALVIGGASLQQQIPTHDFARVTSSVVLGLRSRGDYETTFLIGDGHGAEDALYPSEMANLRATAKPNGAVTDERLHQEFAELEKKTRPGDQVELFISAHGRCARPGEGCEHTFQVYNKDGVSVNYPSKILMDLIAALDKKGVKTNLTMNVCYSGGLEEKVKGLKNTCAFLLASPYDVGFLCSTNLPSVEKYFTSTSETMALRYYAHLIPALEKGYYGTNSCFNNVNKNRKEKLVPRNWATAHDAYWNGLINDSTNHRPSLNTTSEKTRSLLNKFDRRNSKASICSPDSQEAIESLSNNVFEALKVQHTELMKTYNDLMREQDILKEERLRKPQNSKVTERENKVYELLTVKAQDILKLERKILYQNEVGQPARTDDPCKRSL